MTALDKAIRPGMLLTEQDVKQLEDASIYRQNAPFLLQTFFPLFRARVDDSIRTARTTDDLLRCQGRSQLLYEMVQHLQRKLRER